MNTPKKLIPFLLLSVIAQAADFEAEQPAEFARCIPADAKITKLAGGFGFVEGPTWIKDGGYLVFSDIPRDELRRWTAAGGVTTVREKRDAPASCRGVGRRNVVLLAGQRERVVVARDLRATCRLKLFGGHPATQLGRLLLDRCLRRKTTEAHCSDRMLRYLT